MHLLMAKGASAVAGGCDGAAPPVSSTRPAFQGMEPESEPPEPSGSPRRAVHRGRWATLLQQADGPGVPGAGRARVRYAERELYDSVQLGLDSKDAVHNSVLLIPDLLTPVECNQLIDDVDTNGIEGATSGGAGFERHRIESLSASTALLFNRVLRERLLPFVSAELPAVETYMWTRSAGSRNDDPGLQMAPTHAPSTPLHSLPYRFTPNEPAINRYSDGAGFAAHTDQQALTLNVLLRAGSFEGGGTAFWRERKDGQANEDAAHTVCVQPGAGVGVVFNGRVKHAGQPVTAGVRHVLVASFSITNARYASAALSRPECCLTE
jgi:hypothetical protein